MRAATPAPAGRRSLLGLLLLAALGPAAAQEPVDEPPVFGEAIEVNVVNVEVFVTDREGNPVTDLTVDDFRLFEDGRPVVITNFLAVREGRRVGVGGPEEPAGGTDHTGPPLRAAQRFDDIIDEDQRLRLVLFIDNFNLHTNERRRIMDELRAWVRQSVGPQDRVMVVSHERNLEVRQPFTGDVSQVSKALDEVDSGQGLAAQHDSLWRSVLDRIQRADDEGMAAGAIQPYAELVFNDLNHSVDVMRELVDHLAGLPGRKAVLHVSSGLPMVAAAELFGAVEQRFETIGLGNYMLGYDASRRFEALGAHANTAGVTFYTLDASGLRAYGSKSAAAPGYESDRLSQRLDSDYAANLQQPLRFLAEETGGRSIVNQNDVLPPLQEAAADFLNYYSLGYAPSHSGDGRLYSIRVEIQRPGVQVRHRKSYRDEPVESRMADRIRAVLYHSFETNPLEVELAVGAGERRDDGDFEVPIQIRIPVGRLVLVPRGDRYEAHVQLYLAALDERGRVSDVERTPLGIRIPAAAVEAARGEWWLYTHRLLMRRGRQKIAVGLRDAIGAESTFLSRLVTVGG